MCTKNYLEQGISNGSQGIITDFTKDNEPIVTFHNKVKMTIKKENFPSIINPCFYVKQFPITLAWCVTIHKIQGATLDKGIIDIGNNIFEYGQTYVALSRLRNFDNMHLIGFDSSKIKVNKKVIDFYDKMNDPPKKNTQTINSFFKTT